MIAALIIDHITEEFIAILGTFLLKEFFPVSYLFFSFFLESTFFLEKITI